MKRYMPWFLIVSGFLILSIAIFHNVKTTYYQNKIFNEYGDYIEQLKIQDITEALDLEAEHNFSTEYEILTEPHEVDETNIEKSGVVEPVKLFENHEVSGIIEIPKINVNAAILEGIDDRALKYTVGHYPQTAQPGEIGNCVLLGHRNYVYGHFFRRIDELEEGDEVIIKKGTNTYTYVIYESFVVNPEEIWVLDKTSDAIITMITCTPMITYTDRLIVRGKLIE